MKLVQVKGAEAPEMEYCRSYHCPGDCDQPHNQKEREEYASMVLRVFDKLDRAAKRPIIEKRAKVERKAKKAM